MPSDSDGGNQSSGGIPSPDNNNNTSQGGDSNRNQGPGQRRNRKNRGNRQQNQTQTQGSRFEGREPSLKGHIYDLTDDRTDQFIKTTKEVVNWVGRTYKQYTSELSQAVRDLQLADPIQPANPVADNPMAFEVWKLEIKEHRVKLQAYHDFRAGLYNVVLGQCTEVLEERLRSHVDFPGANQDGIALLIIIKSLTHTFEERLKLADSLCDIKERFYTLKQGRNQSLQRYHELFTSQVEVMDEVGATIPDSALVNEVATSNGRTNNANDIDWEQAKQQTLAIRFIRGTNDTYKSYRTHLRNTFLDGSDIYPATLHEAYNILQRREADGNQIPPTGDGVAFVTTGTTDSSDTANPPCNLDHITCFKCGEKGHFANKCPHPDEQTGTISVLTGVRSPSGFTFSQTPTNQIPKEWILLDSQSTVNLFCNRDLLTNVRKVHGGMNIHCNAGSRGTNMTGVLPGFGVIWYDPQAIANILSLKLVQEAYHVSYDSANGNQFIVTRPCGKQYTFQQSESGLYYLNTSKPQEQGVALINTVAAKRAKYTNEDYSRAVKARNLQITLNRPSTKDLIRIITSNLLPNCPVTRADVLAAEDIFGPDVGSLKGKTTRQAPDKVRPDIIRPPDGILDRYRDVVLSADVMYINSVPMLVTRSRNIRFGTVEAIPDQKATTLSAAISKVAKVYERGGFRITVAMMDGQFESTRSALTDIGVTLNTTAEDEHVGDIERYIRTVKERVRAAYNTLPFKRLLPRFIIEMAKGAVYWLNAFPGRDGISDTLSPRAIVTGMGIDYAKHCGFQFGEYVQTHESHNNSMTPRTIGAIAMRPTGNAQGSWHFFSLSTGRLVARMKATKLPMLDDVIDTVHSIARRQKANRGLIFTDRHMVADPDDGDSDDDDSTYAPAHQGVEDEDSDLDIDSDGADDDDSDGNDSDDDDSDDDSSYQPAEDQSSDDEVLDDRGQGYQEDDADDESINDRARDDAVHTRDSEEAEDDGGEAGADGDQPEGANPEESEASGASGASQGRYSMRSRGPRRSPTDYEDLQQPLGTNQHGTAMVNVGGTMATEQMNMKKGLVRFGNDGVDAVRKEMNQLHDRKVMRPHGKRDLTPAQRREALAYLMFLKRKRTGVVKGRGCADGRKQRAYTPRELATSPTVTTESVFLSAVIDAHECRDVAVVDVPGAFMQVDMDELVHVRFTGKMVELLLEIDREMYEPYVTKERGEPVMYVELLKALYGTIRAARQFWEKLTGKLKEWGFTLNPYDSCVANKTINGKQCTVVWHVDDLKISHSEVAVVDSIISLLDKEFGNETPLNKSRGKVHDYLGMEFDFTKPGAVIIRMTDYIQGVLNGAPDDMQGRAVTPAAGHLFDVNMDNPVALDEERTGIFVRVTMQLLYLAQRARPDIRTAIAFLCSRLQLPDEDDYKKLGRVVKYLRGTVDLPLTLSASGTGMVTWWIDASYAVHGDLKGHTGGTMTLGRGSVYSTSTKQKLVTRSSTESEVVGVHDVLPQVLWTSNFLRGQGYPVDDTVLYQDNMSSILLETNGRASSSRRTKHMEVRFFFVKDCVDKKHLRVEYCPTETMLGDFFTKPTQGKLFKWQRREIMNVDPSSKYYCPDPRSVLNSVAHDIASDDHVGTDVRTYAEVVKGKEVNGE